MNMFIFILFRIHSVVLMFVFLNFIEITIMSGTTIAPLPLLAVLVIHSSLSLNSKF